jgi:transcriptional regulator with XRE-family HTH domain
LLLFPIFHLNRLRGVGKKTVRELTGLHAELRLLFPDFKASARTKTTETGGETGESAPTVSTLELLADQLLASGAKGEGKVGRGVVLTILGFPTEQVPSPPFWPSQTEVAQLLGVSRQYVGQAVTGGRERWSRNPSLTDLRKVIIDLLQAQGGAMTPRELAQALLIARGSTLDEPARTLTALAVTRAAVETEFALQEPRLVESRSHGRAILALSDEIADFAFALADEADALAQLDPLAMPQRAIDRLRAITPPAGAPAISDTRLLNVAVANSQKAALSARLEIYPNGMDARRVLQLAQGALFATGEISAEEISRRVKARYPEASGLPDRPELDRLLTELGSRLTWNSSAGNGKGAYCSPVATAVDGSAGSSTATLRASLHPSTPDFGSPEEQAARGFDERLRHSFDQGTFLFLLVPLRSARAAEQALRERFALEHRNCDELLIRALRREADALGARWETVLNADGAVPGSRDWNRLQELVGRAVTSTMQELVAPDKNVLLTQPGLLARYDRLEVLDQFRDEIGRTGSRVHGLWILVPCDDQNALPTLHQRPLRVTSQAQWARIPEAWLLSTPRQTAA